MVGIGEVARAAGVSAATVSRALSGNGPVSPATRERVTRAALELGYVVSSTASSLASGRTKNVGAVVPFLGRWYFSAVIEGAERALLRRGYDLTLYNLAGGGEERRSVFEHFLLRGRVDAVIAVSLELTADEVTRLLALGKPVVGVGGPIPGAPALTMDDIAVSRLITEHLISLGHTRIGLIGGDRESDLDFHLPTSRRHGSEQAIAEAGCPPPRVVGADFTIPGGYRAAKQLLGDPHARPTAIVAASDEMAIGAILAARDLGLNVPGDVSIAGIDDHDLAEFFGLTTVALHPTRQGERAVDALMSRLHPDAPVPTVPGTPAPDDRGAVHAPDPDAPAGAAIPLDFDLVVRSSTARPAV